MNPEAFDSSAWSEPIRAEIKYPLDRFYVDSGDCAPKIQIRLEDNGDIFLSYAPVQVGKNRTLSFEEFNRIFAKAFFDLDFDNKPQVGLFTFR
jgi:hypothetical protein